MKVIDRIYHIAEGEQWQKCLEVGEYVCPSLAAEGFIHCSKAEQVLATANRYYHGVQGLVLIEINPKKLSANLKYESGHINEFFPHIYGPLNLDAVEKVLAFLPDANGEFTRMPA
jgi:uncharacterized protein (DUF952 family)